MTVEEVCELRRRPTSALDIAGLLLYDFERAAVIEFERENLGLQISAVSATEAGAWSQWAGE